jgi:aminoglycoside phosphotransferase (APT) family kinase protein
MAESTDPDPNEQRAPCEEYFSRSLKSRVRLVHAERLAKSTRDAPWRLDVEVGGARRRYVLRCAPGRGEHEYAVLRAMESIPIPTPRAYGWDPEGEAFGVPCFFYEFVEGESLRGPMLAGERWAEEVFIATVCALQDVGRSQLSVIADRLAEEETAEAFLEAAHEQFATAPDPLADAVYGMLRETRPEAPAARFSNGDLWLDNLIVRDGRLAGVVDFENAGFSDPIYEFLLPFFVSPGLRRRGIEECYCERMGFDAGVLGWYRGLEYFDTWHWVRATGRPFEQYTEDALRTALERWLAEARAGGT